LFDPALRWTVYVPPGAGDPDIDRRKKRTAVRPQESEQLTRWGRTTALRLPLHMMGQVEGVVARWRESWDEVHGLQAAMIASEGTIAPPGKRPRYSSLGLRKS